MPQQPTLADQYMALSSLLRNTKGSTVNISTTATNAQQHGGSLVYHLQRQLPDALKTTVDPNKMAMFVTYLMTPTHYNGDLQNTFEAVCRIAEHLANDPQHRKYTLPGILHATDNPRERVADLIDNHWMNAVGLASYMHHLHGHGQYGGNDRDINAVTNVSFDNSNRQSASSRNATQNTQTANENESCCLM